MKRILAISIIALATTTIAASAGTRKNDRQQKRDGTGDSCPVIERVTGTFTDAIQGRGRGGGQRKGEGNGGGDRKQLRDGSCTL